MNPPTTTAELLVHVLDLAAWLDAQRISPDDVPLPVAARRRRSQRSRLDRYRAEIERLAGAGASSYDIALWLRKCKRTRVHPTTVWRALRRWRSA